MVDVGTRMFRGGSDGCVALPGVSRSAEPRSRDGSCPRLPGPWKFVSAHVPRRERVFCARGVPGPKGDRSAERWCFPRVLYGGGGKGAWGREEVRPRLPVRVPARLRSRVSPALVNVSSLPGPRSPGMRMSVTERVRASGTTVSVPAWARSREHPLRVPFSGKRGPGAEGWLR